jgi:hypothetical protein
MPRQEKEPLTFGSLRAAQQELNACQTADDVRAVFKRYYETLGYRRLCRMFVLGWRPEEMWLREEDRINGVRRRGF